jgi:predicted Zn-dependent protease
MKLRLIAAFLAAAMQWTAMPAISADAAPADGVKVGKASSLRKLVPAEQLERAAAQQYVQMKGEASSKRALAPDNHPQLQRLRAIARELIPHSYKFNERARAWQWEVSLIASDQINAFCMPGGKIAFYTGILDKLKLTDDEVAMVMGHEIAHALREHARERIAKTELTRTGGALIADLFGVGDLGRAAMNVGGNLLTLKFSREDESESDLIGMELAARAGYDPRAGVTLWQKMGAASKGAPPQWLSTHPSGTSRIDEIKRHLPEVMPIYERTAAARKTAPSAAAPATRAVR